MFKVIFLFVVGDSVFTFFFLSPWWRKASYNTSEQEMSSLGSGSGCLLLLIIPNGAKNPFFNFFLFFFFCRSGIINPRFWAGLSKCSAFGLFKVPHVVPVEQSVLFCLWYNDFCTTA